LYVTVNPGEFIIII